MVSHLFVIFDAQTKQHISKHFFGTALKKGVLKMKSGEQCVMWRFLLVKDNKWDGPGTKCLFALLCPSWIRLREMLLVQIPASWSNSLKKQ